MQFIETKFFNNQVIALERNFNKINNDLEYFKDEIDLRFGIHLGEGIYKFRLKNTSIPVGKSGGFRIIAKISGQKILPILIYSKTQKSNVSKNDIIEALKITLNEF